MTKHILFPIFLTALVIIVLGFASKKYQQETPLQKPIETQANTPKTARIKIKGKEIEAEIAKTEEERIRGLSNRNSIGNFQGMIFVFPQKDVTPTFWMKDMRFPIDIIWINDNKIVKIDENLDYPKEQTNQSLSLYKPPSPVDYVLEVKANLSKENDWKEGDAVEILDNL